MSTGDDCRDLITLRVMEANIAAKAEQVIDGLHPLDQKNVLVLTDRQIESLVPGYVDRPNDGPLDVEALDEAHGVLVETLRSSNERGLTND